MSLNAHVDSNWFVLSDCHGGTGIIFYDDCLLFWRMDCETLDDHLGLRGGRAGSTLGYHYSLVVV